MLELIWILQNRLAKAISVFNNMIRAAKSAFAKSKCNLWKIKPKTEKRVHAAKSEKRLPTSSATSLGAKLNWLIGTGFNRG